MNKLPPINALRVQSGWAFLLAVVALIAPYLPAGVADFVKTLTPDFVVQVLSAGVDAANLSIELVNRLIALGLMVYGAWQRSNPQRSISLFGGWKD